MFTQGKFNVDPQNSTEKRGFRNAETHSCSPKTSKDFIGADNFEGPRSFGGQKSAVERGACIELLELTVYDNKNCRYTVYKI
jgi:hypothetical protein